MAYARQYHRRKGEKRHVPYTLSETEGHAQEEKPLGFCKILGLQRKGLTGLLLLPLLRI